MEDKTEDGEFLQSLSVRWRLLSQLKVQSEKEFVHDDHVEEFEHDWQVGCPLYGAVSSRIWVREH